ncbi:MAG TPA: hypothetical protein VMF03_08765 [Steroidobacteraceae bacterium]|nr:hypothetical protein [Steroidobacteraceae bacterium]
MLNSTRATGALLMLCASLALAQSAPPAAKKSAAAGDGQTDLIGRPVDLDLSRGVQAPPRDTSRLPTTFAGAAKTQPVNPNWGKVAYKPRSRRDLTGIWINQGGIGWTPGVPPGPQQHPPLTPAYAKLFAQHLADAAAGRPTGDPTASCLPPGMPRVMTMTYPMEITMGPDRIMIYAEWDEQVRRIFTDGRPLDADPDPTFNGQSVGHWEGNFLISTAFGFRLETNMESSGLPKSDKAIAYERIWLADDDTLRDEFTLVDPVALTRPWTVTKTFRRAPPDFEIEPYVCLENNRNPITPDGSIHVILQTGDKQRID